MKNIAFSLALIAVCSPAVAASPSANTAAFSHTRISGEALFGPRANSVGREQYVNPVLAGFYPDPSIERVGDDYYLINSSFAFYPGIPVFHSKDLVHWRQIGNAINRPGMLDFSGLGTSRGVFAPDLSYHNGTFFIVNTCVDCKGNFLIRAKNPAGPWTDPVWLPFDGIDPSLFWDDDGRAYIVNNGAPDGPELYSGHRALWMQEFDPSTNTLVGPRVVVVNGGVDISKKPVWIEGPHIFKKDGLYYLMAAEGGTGDDHSEVVFRSEKAMGPYVPYEQNPILTQRDLDPGRPDAITSSGHADIVQTQTGDWWSVFLATRPYAPGLYNTGRETFALPVTWKDGWPVILPHQTPIPLLAQRPALPLSPDSHGQASLAMVGIRTPVASFYHRSKHGVLTLSALPEAIGDVNSHPSFLGYRQQQPKTQFVTTIKFRPQNEGDRAGIVAVQSDDFYLFYGIVQHNGRTVLELTRRTGNQDPRDGVVVASRLIDMPSRGLTLQLDLNGGIARCSYLKSEAQQTLADNVDVTNLSSAKAGGFVGSIIGVYAYSAGKP